MKMKKIIAVIFTTLLMVPAAASEFRTNAKSAFLIDFDSGADIVAKNADDLMIPSSMVKLMTLVMAFDAVKDGRLRLDDRLPVSNNADYRNRIWAPASKICLMRGQEITVRDIILGLIVVSGGDAGVVLAEHLAGSEEDFTTQMIRRARAIGLQQSTFGNTSGLPHPDNLMTSRELALLGEYIIREYPEFYPKFATRRFEFNERQSAWCNQWGNLHSVSYNRLLFIMPSADGLKTGHTSAGGYGMVASARRQGRRLVGVINGFRGKDHNALGQEMKRLLDYGFANTTTRIFFKQGDTVAQIPVWYGRKKTVQAVAARPVAATLAAGENVSQVRIVARYKDPLPAPIAAGASVGDIVVEKGGKVVGTVPMIAKHEVGKVRILGRMIKNVKIILGGKK